MNFATWSIHNPIPSILLFIMLTVAGLYGFKQLPIQNLPDIDLPMITVTLALPGAAPAQLETEIARKVEDSIATLSGLKHIATSITDGIVAVNVEFVLEKNISDALIETKDAVDRVRMDLPSDLEPPTVTAVQIGSEPIVTYAISSKKMSEEELSWFVDDTVNKKMLSLTGVGRFDRLGGVTREVRVEVDPARMAALGVTASDVSRALRQVQMEASGGRGQIGRSEQSVRTIATVRRAEELQDMAISLPDGRFVRLSQIATIEDAPADRALVALFNGAPAIGFQIYRAKGFDETQIALDAKDALAALKKEHPDLEVTLVNSSVDYTLEQYEGSMHMLYEGALLAVLVVWFFLRDWRATLISAVALPLSIIPTFAAMYWLDYTLNTLTLLALAVVVGILVDDAIVEVENIVRHKRAGKPILQAAEEAVDEIALAVIATTLTLIVVFMPTALMSGITGLFFQQFGWTIVISVFFSLLVARLLTPVMAAYFLKDDQDHGEEEDGPIMTHYLRMVDWSLTYRKTTMFVATVFLAGSLMLGGLLSSGFLPPSDIGFTNVTFELPPGSSIDDTIETAEAARKAIENIEGVENIFASVGAASQQGPQQSVGEIRKGSLIVALLPRGQREAQGLVEKDIRRALQSVPGARFALTAGGPGEKMALILSSDNADALLTTARQLETELRTIPALSNISSTASLQRPEIIIRPDMERAAELGVSTAAIADTIRIATAGDFDAQLAKLNLDNRQIYIRVRMPDAARRDLETIANLRVPTRNGHTALGTVADISISTGPAQIDRYDRHRYVVINADLGGTPLGEAMDIAGKLPAIKNMPSSVEMIETGDAEMMMELFSGFGIAMLTGVMCVFCVLVVLFKDFFQPVTILSALPLSIGGSIIAMVATGGQLSLPALIGIVMLMGIVTKNSILLVEYTIVGMRDRGMSRYDAIMDACHKRARPIVMTTVAMIAGMMPIALGFGGDASFRQPMAISVIGGLITSTVLSLIIVPVTFTYIDGLERRLRGLFAKNHDISGMHTP